MIHFLFLMLFAVAVAVVFAVVHTGTPRARAVYGAQIFAQFVLIALGLAWIFYFLPD